MKRQVRWSLSVMMFLQYSIWGAWYPVLSAYMEKIGFSGTQVGVIYSLLSVGCMLAPSAAGQLADRYFATERMLSVLHLAGAALLFFMAPITNYDRLWPMMLAWSVVYAPTLALTSSLCFHHMPEAEKDFGLVRVWGTIGWIAVGVVLGGLRLAAPDMLRRLGGADSLWVAGVLSLVLGLYSLALPHTPPAQTGADLWAFIGAFKLLRDPQFAIFIIVSFVVATELMFYYVLTGPFLQTIGVSPAKLPIVMDVAQIAEIGTMIALPWMLSRWGVRRTMFVGILAWPVRYAVFSWGQPLWLVVTALTLHGLCYVCFFTVSQIYVNEVAGADIRASAQGLITFVTLGAGLSVGSLFAGMISDFFTTLSAGGVRAVDYTKVFLVPLAITILCAIVFILSFRERAWGKRPGETGA
jgi:nucleoside transporter